MDDAVISLIIVSLIVLAVVTSGLLAVYTWFRISHPVSESYGLLMAADSLWAGGYLLMIIGGGGLLTDVGLIAKALFSSLAAVAWLLFVSEYTGDSEWIPNWFWWLMTAEAVLFGGLVAINPGDLVINEVMIDQFGLFTFAIESTGVITALQLLISAGLVVVSLGFLGRFSIQTQSVYRYQALIIYAIGGIVVTSSVLFVGEYRIHPLIDPTPILFNLQAVAVGWALYRYDFLKLAPVVVTRFYQNMSDPVLIINSEFVVADYNTAAERLVDGLDEQIPISRIGDKEFSEMLRTTVGGSGTAAASEFTKLRTDGGHQRTYDVEETHITDQFDITQGYVVVLRDITDRKRRERRLRKQNERLEEFADIVSHDLRNPLSTATGWTEIVDRKLAAEEPDIEGAKEGIDQLVDSHNRMDELIEVLLTMAQQGQTVDETESVSLEQVATEAWSTADTGELELVIETDQQIEADPVRLRGAFENLFRNAADHGSASNRARPGDADDHGSATTVYVTETATGFAVEDDGKGIGDDRGSLFEFGYTTDDEGTGIGLAVVKRIIEAHGWQITAEDGEHGGARFEIAVV